MDSPQQYSLRWNNYLRHITYAFDTLRIQDDFVDVTLYCDGHRIKAHKVLLSACSGYFKEIFQENPCSHPVIIFKFIKYDDLRAIIDFIYQGEVSVHQDALQSFLQTAELLSIQGLVSEEKEKQPLKDNITRIEQDLESNQIRAPTQVNVQTSTLDIPISVIQNIGVEKRKVMFTNEEVPEQTQQLAQTVKVSVPEYIQIHDERQAIQPSNTHRTATPNNQYTEIEILTESEIVDGTELESKPTKMEQTDNSDIVTDDSGDERQMILSQSTNPADEENKSRNESTSNTEEVFQCKICKRFLQSLSALKRHNASKHGSILRKYDCAMCRKKFKTKWSLSTHNSRFHRESKFKESIKMNFTFQ